MNAIDARCVELQQSSAVMYEGSRYWMFDADGEIDALAMQQAARRTSALERDIRLEGYEPDRLYN